MKEFKKMYVSNPCFDKCKFVRIKSGQIYCKLYSVVLTTGYDEEVNRHCMEYVYINDDKGYNNE